MPWRPTKMLAQGLSSVLRVSILKFNCIAHGYDYDVPGSGRVDNTLSQHLPVFTGKQGAERYFVKLQRVQHSLLVRGLACLLHIEAKSSHRLKLAQTGDAARSLAQNVFEQRRGSVAP